MTIVRLWEVRAPASGPTIHREAAEPKNTNNSKGNSVIWLDELIAQGDPGDDVSLLHRQAVWLELLRRRRP